MTEPKDDEIAELLMQGESARLIPVVADTSKEQRITSALLSVMMAVDEFGRAMLANVDAPTAKIARLQCFTEVTFKSGQELDRKLRPDGLIFVKRGKRTWSAIVEAKVGGAQLDTEQVEAYLDIAKANKIDAVITVSNQFAPLPTHHPIQVNRRKLKAVELYHWSWTSVLSEAILTADHKGVFDPDQAFILSEFIRYLQHDSSGVHPFPRLGKGWKAVCTSVQHAVPLAKGADEVIDSVAEWQQLVRFLSLQLGMSIGRDVAVYMTKAHIKDPGKSLDDAVAGFIKSNCLCAAFKIPNAASLLSLGADVNRRTLSAGMKLSAPTDRSTARARITWLVRQLKKCDDGQLAIRANWPYSTPDTWATLEELREDPRAILPENTKLLPKEFEVVRIKDIGAGFKGAKKFVEEIDAFLPRFYADVGQHLKAWVPPPPKVEKVEETADEGETE